MPFKSKAQQGKIFAMEARGEIKKGTGERWAKETPNMKALPERVAPKKPVTKHTSVESLRKTYAKKFGGKK